MPPRARKAITAQVAEADDVVDVPPELVFTTPPPADEAPPEEQPFSVDGETYTSVRPKDAAFALLARAGSRHASDVEKLSAVFEFLDAAMTHESASRLADRLRDTQDSFDLPEAVDIMTKLVDHWRPAPNRAARRARR